MKERKKKKKKIFKNEKKKKKKKKKKRIFKNENKKKNYTFIYYIHPSNRYLIITFLFIDIWYSLFIVVQSTLLNRITKK